VIPKIGNLMQNKAIFFSHECPVVKSVQVTVHLKREGTFHIGHRLYSVGI